MGFQRHESYMEKQVRKLKYQILIAHGIPSDKATRYRDWTYNKVMMICKGEATPV